MKRQSTTSELVNRPKAVTTQTKYGVHAFRLGRFPPRMLFRGPFVLQPRHTPCDEYLRMRRPRYNTWWQRIRTTEATFRTRTQQ